MSQGSVVQRDERTFVIEKLQQSPRTPLGTLTFGQLAKFKREDVEGRLWMLVHEIEIVDSQVERVLRGRTWRLLGADSEWQYLGQIEKFTQAHGLQLPTSASGISHGCSNTDPVFLLGMNMDGCGPYKFSKTLEGTNLLYLRSWTLRASFRHFCFPCAAVPKGVDPSLAVGMLGRDVSIMERGDVCTVKAGHDGVARWQRIFCHLANFVSDRDGSENPLGRIHASAKTKSEWKGFLGWRDGFGLGPRAEGNHEFGGNARYLRSVCGCVKFMTKNFALIQLYSTSIIFMKSLRSSL